MFDSPGLELRALASGSSGNATLIAGGGTRVLIDAGMTLTRLTALLARAGVPPRTLSAVLVTHSHRDHSAGLGPLARRHQLPLYLTAGTARELQRRLGRVPVIETVRAGEPFPIGALTIEPLKTSHDTAEPVAYAVAGAGRRVAVITDTGQPTPALRAALGTLDAVLLEANHDEQMLADGPYPEELKDRIIGRYGHLSNRQAGALLAAAATPRLRAVLLGHLSEHNNTPALALAAVRAALRARPDLAHVTLSLAPRHEPSAAIVLPPAAGEERSKQGRMDC